MRSLEHTVIGASPKQFFTSREGDIAYTLQRGSNFFGSKQIPKSHPTRSYVETVKALVQARLKHVQQPLINKKVKAGSMKNIVEFSSDNSHTQVVVSETQAGSFPQSVVGGGEGGEGGINGKNKIEEKIPEGNNVNIPLKPNLN
nr:hypothetical protein CFP56_48036 [Quercus suber]